ncbi:MAG: 50S ribosomal protein L10 [Candidatus Omnitrophota bacterium]|nr:MAG: 50S ribosomal protein L10 [Candidatus Omnitrophota bacterium]
MEEHLKPGRLLKQHMIDHIAARLQGASNLFVTECGSLSNKQMEELRGKLKKASSNYMVVKNSMSIMALEKINLDMTRDLIKGTCGISYNSKDPVMTSKILVNFTKEYKEFKFKGACIEGKVVSADTIKEIAAIPPREILLARLVSSLNSPIKDMAGVLYGIIRKLVYALNAIKDKKQEGGN